MDLNFKKEAAKELDRITLKAQKVEFAVIDDAKKALDKFVKLRKEADNFMNNAYVPVREIEKATNALKGDIANMSKYAKELRAAESEVETQVDKARKLAKELGVDINSNDLLDYSLYNNTIKISDDLQKDADTFIKFVNKLPKL
jgi:soluble cytochrome b562